MDNIPEVITSSEEDFSLHSPNSPFVLPLRISNFDEEKELVKFVRNIEKLVRVSTEYRYWIRYLIETVGVNQCSITHELMNECRIEIHHHPISLFVICKAVLMDAINHDRSFCTFDLAIKIIELHFQNRVGFVPLLSDLHKKYHDGYQKVPMDLIRGNYQYIMEHYSIDDSDLEDIYELCNVHLADVEQTWTRENYPGLLPEAVNQ